jgi:23S rRNA (cytosine1962-C5)-methyltransferase
VTSRPPAASLPKVKLKKDLRRALHAGAPWIYRDAVGASTGIEDGALVLVLGKDSRPLGRGYFDEKGAIAVRMLTTNRADEVPLLVRARLEEARDARRALFESGETTAFRWVHGEGDRLPGLHVDVYARHASVAFDSSGARAFYLGLGLLDAMFSLGSPFELAGVVERTRREGGSPVAATALAGTFPNGEVLVREHGLSFGVDLVFGQKGGLFLDQRENRVRVGKLARGRSVLNLFGYTGGFSLHAARGGATRTVTVDAAGAAIEAAKRNFAKNAELLGRAARSDEFVAADAFEFLREAGRKGERFGLVVSDPPSFAPSERARAAALASYVRLHALAASVVERGGILCAASCSSHVSETDFLQTVRDGADRAGRSFELHEIHGAASDHPVIPEFPEGRYLKFAIGTLR